MDKSLLKYLQSLLPSASDEFAVTFISCDIVITEKKSNAVLVWLVCALFYAYKYFRGHNKILAMCEGIQQVLWLVFVHNFVKNKIVPMCVEFDL